MLGAAVVTGFIALLLGAVGGYLAGNRSLAFRGAPAPEPLTPLPPVIAAAVEAVQAVQQGTDQPLASLVVEALDHGVVVLDGGDRAILVNPAARAMGVLDVDRLAFPDLARAASSARSRATVVTNWVDLPIGRLGREPIALAVTAVPLALESDGDGVQSVALLLADVSEQRRLEAVRRDFVANVSHELKTPVGALTLLAEAVQDAADDPPTVARFASRMQHEGARLARLVGELMELSRVQGMDPMPGALSVDVRTLVDESADRAGLAAEQAGIEIVVNCDDELVVRGNEAQLITAVANLVDNAIAYSARGTRVEVVASASSDHQARPTVDIAISDQGLGIADADVDRIFERFYRVDPARSRATGGTGLGLAIVKNIVTNHLGTVSVASEVGRGSTFTIRLPRVHSSTSPSTVSTPTAGAVKAVNRARAAQTTPAPTQARGSA
ncbi:MAG: ATP-binding protein [Actinomycetota bacterium]|nr:ATP-binding protein [Actinomycetota bacterium]